MKRKLALLMAFMMAATLVPAKPVSAASENSVNKVVSARTNSVIDVASGVTLFVGPGSSASVAGAEVGKPFEVQLSDGIKWADEMFTTTHTNATVERATDSIIKVTPTAANVTLAIAVDLSGAPVGDQKVTVISKGTTVSNGTYVFATTGDSDIKLRTEKKEKISRTGTNKVSIILDETTTSSFNGGEAILRLPKGFTWDTKTNTTNIAVSTDDARDLKITLGALNTTLDSIYVDGYIVVDRDARLGDVDVSVKSGKISPSSLVVAENVTDSVEVKAEKVLDVIAGKDVSKLYVAKVTLEENVTNALLKGRYVEFQLKNASVQADETVTLKRLANGIIDIDFDKSSSKAIDTVSTGVSDDSAKYKTKFEKEGDKFDLKVVENSTGNTPGKFELEIPFVVNSNFTGEVVLNVKGAGITGNADNGGIDVVIANAKAPVTVTTTNPLPQVKIGLQAQKGADITITETEVGALQDFQEGNNRSYALYSLTTTKSNFGIEFDKVNIKVEESNLTLDDDASGRARQIANGFRNKIEIAVDRKSTDKPAVIKLSNIELTLDRTVPYGPVELDANFGLVKDRQNTEDFTNRTVRLDYITTVTPVSESRRITTVFTIGEKTYKEIIGGVEEEKTAEVAPFIDPSANRTMLPVRYIANAVGAEVNYDPVTRVATFTKDQIVISINIDADVMYVNGSPVQLASKPTNVEGRIFLPLVNIAQAFGLKQDETIIWNADARTVTILPQDASAEEIAAAKSSN